MKPAKSNVPVFRQILQVIPASIIKKLEIKHEIQTRSYSVWSHVVSHLFAQFSHALSLNDLCDNLSNHAAIIKSVRNASAPKRSTLSNANRTRTALFAQDLFWEILKYLQKVEKNFGHKYSKFPKGFQRGVYAIDSTTIPLVADCMDWAKHRRQKAAAKCHMQIKLNSFLPSFAIVKEANTHDSTEAKELCANLTAGEVALFDKAYVDYKHLCHLNERGVYWVTRAKGNMSYEVTQTLSESKGKILRDEEIKLKGKNTFDNYPQKFRRVEAEVEIDGKPQIMVFICNHFNWAPSSIAALYQARWGIEVFFKQLKQTLQISSFLGYNKNALQWQVWMALLSYVLLRFLQYKSKWKNSFSRLFTMIKGVLWSYLDIFRLLKSYGTAKSPPKPSSFASQGYLPGLFEKVMGQPNPKLALNKSKKLDGGR